MRKYFGPFELTLNGFELNFAEYYLCEGNIGNLGGSVARDFCCLS